MFFIRGTVVASLLLFGTTALAQTAPVPSSILIQGLQPRSPDAPVTHTLGLPGPRTPRPAPVAETRVVSFSGADSTLV
jgi:hypothetical protein